MTKKLLFKQIRSYLNMVNDDMESFSTIYRRAFWVGVNMGYIHDIILEAYGKNVITSKQFDTLNNWRHSLTTHLMESFDKQTKEGGKTDATE